MKNSLKILAWLIAGIFVVASGLIIGTYVLGKFAADQDQTSQEEAIKKMTLSEQKRIGADCNSYKSELQGYLDSMVRPLIEQRVRGQGWASLLHQKEIDATERQYKVVSTCFGLYTIGQDGKLNGINQLNYRSAMEEISTIRLFVSQAPKDVTDACNASCLDSEFDNLSGAYRSLLALVK